jgi:hypothetical protein
VKAVARVRVLAVAVLLFALVGCDPKKQAGDQPSSSVPPVTTTTAATATATASSSEPPQTGGETSPPDQDNPCTADVLTGTIQPRNAGAGNRVALLVVTNKSQKTCTLWGYGGVELMDLAKNVIPTVAERNLDPGPALVTLAPGFSAAKNLHWGVVPTGDEPTDGPCQVPSTGIRVLPPDETAQFEVAFEFGSVCDHGRIETSAYFAN